MLHGLNGYPLAGMALSLAAEGYCLIWGKGVRFIAFFAALTAAFAVAAFPPWLDALAVVFGTGPGMVVLAVGGIGCGAAYVTDQMRHLHVTRTPILGTVAGTAIVLIWAMRSQLATQGAKIGPGTAAALGQATRQIQSGQAAASMSMSSAVLIIGVALGALFVIWRFRKRLHESRKQQGRPFFHVQPFGVPLNGGGRKAIAAGPGGPVMPGGPGAGKAPKAERGGLFGWRGRRR